MCVTLICPKLVRKLKLSRPFRDARFQSTFNRVSRQIIRRAESLVCEERLGILQPLDG